MSSILEVLRRARQFAAYTDNRLDLFHYLLILLFIVVFALSTSMLYIDDFSTHGNHTSSTASDRSWPLWSRGKTR